MSILLLRERHAKKVEELMEAEDNYMSAISLIPEKDENRKESCDQIIADIDNGHAKLIWRSSVIKSKLTDNFEIEAWLSDLFNVVLNMYNLITKKKGNEDG